MAAASKNILIFGATGVIGLHITQALLNAKAHFGRVAAFTSSGTAESKKHIIQGLEKQGLEVVIGDIHKEEDIISVYKEFDTVISALGRNVIASQIDLIRLAEASNSIIRFFPSEYGTDIEYGPASAMEKPHQQKLKVRKYISSSVNRLEYTYLVTGPYADMYIAKSPDRPEMGTFDVKAKRAVLLGDADGKISFTTMPDVGKLLVAALKRPEATRNRALKVNSFTSTPNAILAEFERQTGQKWDISYISLTKLKELENKAWEEQVPWATSFTLRRIWAEGGTLYEKRDNSDIGMEDEDMENLEIVVKRAISQQT
ncbi:isoflavone reductase family protein [Glonium stellatum]|uniref:Isoflavone reductase family protein n=1 Tax=Glonium stellatum TaxID=574774 RepID=A0A8E2F9R4_9PEZI|nr:isoflavone reductase family protein [Glonium stellatum]